MNTIGWLESLGVVGRLPQHLGEETRPPSEWTWEPSVIIGTILIVGIYLYAIDRGHRRQGQTDKISPVQVSAFLLGCLVLFLSLVSPLDVLSDEYLFSAHMVQHVLLAVVVPLFLLLGTPGWLIRPLLKPPIVARTARVLTAPIPAFLLFNVVFWLWHLPFLYDLAVANEQIHILEHLSFMATGLLNWWPVLSPLPELPRLSYPWQLLYIALNCQPNVVLGAILFFSRGLLYESYVNVPRLFDMSPYVDQQIGGLIMWIPENAIYTVIFSIIFIRWLQQEEPDQRQLPV